MKNHTKNTPRMKPSKPYPDFPLFAHATGRWAKKVRGQLKYFGPWEDWQRALNKWLEQRDDLMAGRLPQEDTGKVTVRDLVNAFLTSKLAATKTGDISRRTFQDYYQTGARVIAAFGKTRAADNLGPADFQMLANRMQGWAPVTRANEIQRTRTLFKYGYEATLIDKPIIFGPDFRKPSAKVIRAAKADKPTRLFNRQEIRTLLNRAPLLLRAMILLGINAGLGNTDVSELNREHLDLRRGILEYPRPKTAIERRATLWPETVKALKAVLARGQEIITVGASKGRPRHRPKDPKDEAAVFLTHQQRRFVRHNETIRDSVAMAFGKLLRAVGLKREGIGFYSLRHTFESVAGETRDQAAVDRIMGHHDPHVRGHCLHWAKNAEEDTRLRRVTNHVHQWLFGK